MGRAYRWLLLLAPAISTNAFLVPTDSFIAPKQMRILVRSTTPLFARNNNKGDGDGEGEQHQQRQGPLQWVARGIIAMNNGLTKAEQAVKQKEMNYMKGNSRLAHKVSLLLMDGAPRERSVTKKPDYNDDKQHEVSFRRDSRSVSISVNHTQKLATTIDAVPTRIREKKATIKEAAPVQQRQREQEEQPSEEKKYTQRQQQQEQQSPEEKQTQTQTQLEKRMQEEQVQETTTQAQTPLNQPIAQEILPDPQERPTQQQQKKPAEATTKQAPPKLTQAAQNMLAQESARQTPTKLTQAIQTKLLAQETMKQTQTTKLNNQAAQAKIAQETETRQAPPPNLNNLAAEKNVAQKQLAQQRLAQEISQSLDSLEQQMGIYQTLDALGQKMCLYQIQQEELIQEQALYEEENSRNNTNASLNNQLQQNTQEARTTLQAFLGIQEEMDSIQQQWSIPSRDNTDALLAELKFYEAQKQQFLAQHERLARDIVSLQADLVDYRSAYEKEQDKTQWLQTKVQELETEQQTVGDFESIIAELQKEGVQRQASLEDQVRQIEALESGLLEMEKQDTANATNKTAIGLLMTSR